MPPPPPRAFFPSWTSSPPAGSGPPPRPPPPPPPLALFATGEVWPHLQATFTAALLGLFWGILLGGALGLLAALSPFFSDLLEPIMLLLNAIPRVILAPLFVIWLGIGLGIWAVLSFAANRRRGAAKIGSP